MKKLITLMTLMTSMMVHATPVISTLPYASSLESSDQLLSEELGLDENAPWPTIDEDYEGPEDKGFRLKPSHASMDFAFLNRKIYLDRPYLEKYIKRANYKLPEKEIKVIAQAIDRVATCLKVDSFLLAGLIHKESYYDKNAVSKSGAAGLTQFTSIGIKEVNDQLGLNGIIGAPLDVTEYYRNKIYECINPKWVDVWNLIKVAPGHPKFYDQIKVLIKTNPLIAVTYGGILLKTYVANMHNRNITENLRYSPAEIYFYALQAYNGEPGERKVNYAKKIFSFVYDMYPAPIRARDLHFPFLK